MQLLRMKLPVAFQLFQNSRKRDSGRPRVHRRRVERHLEDEPDLRRVRRWIFRRRRQSD